MTIFTVRDRMEPEKYGYFSSLEKAKGAATVYFSEDERSKIVFIDEGSCWRIADYGYSDPDDLYDDYNWLGYIEMSVLDEGIYDHI